MSASVCRTESCTRAATSERSSLRILADRSASRSSARRHSHGPAIRSSAPATAPGASSDPPGRPPSKQQHRSAGGEHQPDPGERSIGAEAAAAPREREAGGDQDDRGDRAVRRGRPRAGAATPAPTTSSATQHRGARVAVRPEREVEKDPGAAGEREQREDQADERDVDGEGLRDSCADPRDHALVSAAGEARAAPCGSLIVGAVLIRTDPTCTRASTTSTRAAGRPGALVGVPAVVLVAEHVYVAEPCPSVRAHRHVARDDDLEVAVVDAGLHVRLADGQPDIASGRGRARRCRAGRSRSSAAALVGANDLSTDPMAEVHRKDRDEDRSGRPARERRDAPSTIRIVRQDVPLAFAGAAARLRRRPSSPPRRSAAARLGGGAGAALSSAARGSRIAPPASRSRIQAASPCGQRVDPGEQHDARQRRAARGRSTARGGRGSRGGSRRRSSPRGPRRG